MNPEGNNCLVGQSVSVPGLLWPATHVEKSKLHDWFSHHQPYVKHHLESLNTGSAKGQFRRRQEFAAGRAIASKLLASFGEDREVGVNDDRSPDWPHGFVGSISHSHRWIWVAVARDFNVRSVGIDTERVVDAATAQQIGTEVANDYEWKAARALGLSFRQTFSLVFSAKEAFYKCWYPVTGKYFGFEQATVDSVQRNCLRIRSSENNPNFGIGPDFLDVLFHVDEQDVFTATSMKCNRK